MTSIPSTVAADGLRECREAYCGGVEALVLIPPTVTASDVRQREWQMVSPYVAAALCEALCAAADRVHPAPA